MNKTIKAVGGNLENSLLPGGTPVDIHLAIPHYNAPEALRKLLGQVVKCNFDSVTVLDDCSADSDSLKSVAREFPMVSFVFGESNLGAGGNRNRFLKQNKTGVVWFLDCDMRIETPDAPDILRQKFANDRHILLGSTILSASGEPMAWNYGHEMHPRRDREFARACDADDREFLRQKGWDYPWIWGEKTTTDRQVDWVAEGSFAVRIDDFQKVGGYDTEFRYHEGQDLARRLREIGALSLVTSDIVCTHLEIDVRGSARQHEVAKAAELFYRKHNISV